MKKIKFFAGLVFFSFSSVVYSEVLKRCELIEFAEMQTLKKEELIPLYCKNTRRLVAAQRINQNELGDLATNRLMGVQNGEKRNIQMLSLTKEIIDSCSSVAPLLRSIRRSDSNFTVEQCSNKITATATSTNPITALGSPFEKGELILEGSMFGKGAWGGDGLKTLYDNAKWDELVDGVISKRFVSNLYYFYLGRAAEEFGYGIAAAKYYHAAINTGKFSACEGSMHSCQGFKFPDSANKQLANFDLGID